ncbi:bolA-like protein 1 [[Candida] anglica]|uniref:BolA-like protein 1 n=1 Tax=[Candida] anglica TaxID=148631 RepID=A0ABP0EAY7_9ASCO
MLRYIRKMSTSINISPSAGPIETKIVKKLHEKFQPVHFSIVNDSHKHAHHAGLRGATNKTESHFNVEIVSSVFEGKNLPARHRLVYGTLSEELEHDGLHALQMKTKTPEEYEKRKI